MDANPGVVAHQLKSIIVRSLDNFNYKNAEFASERLLALSPLDPDSIHLYALVLYRLNKYKTVYNQTSDALSRSGNHIGCAYLYARACLHLNKFKEGIFRLVSLSHLYNEKSHIAEAGGTFNDPQNRQYYLLNRSLLPDSSEVYHLLGDLYSRQGDAKNAALNYQQALKFNAFDFEAFQKLARSGAEIKVRNIYGSLAKPVSTNDLGARESIDSPVLANPFATTPRSKFSTDAGREIMDRSFQGLERPQAISRPSYATKRPERSMKRASSLTNFDTHDQQPMAVLKDILDADAYLHRLYLVFAKGYRSMCKFDCYKAIRILESLPEQEKDTPWVLAISGRLHFEIVNYKQLRKLFMRLRELDRTRLDDMEYYLTLLWHLQKKVELTYLACELQDIDPKSPITWCVMGNLFSLLRESDEAIRCFDKAIAADETRTYAHTLKGHELFSNDNYEQALECFRVSLLLDPRHYNAFYGIGMVYINLGEYQKADYHFRKAVAINPINIILICCVGMVLEKLGKKLLALRQYELAHKLQPLSPLPIFKKAQILFAMQQFPRALKQFEMVRDLAPNEASVHFLLGQLYKIQNDKFEAIREFTIALNLDPKGNYLVREAMEMLKNEEN